MVRAAIVRRLYPRIPLQDLSAMAGVALLGGALAGVYGILHDQVTYWISSEYFTKLKFAQFHYLNWGLGDRVFVAAIGFWATWWVGVIAAWFLARRFLPNQPRSTAYRQIFAGFGCVLASGMACGGLGFLYGIWRGPDADYSPWEWAFVEYGVSECWSFVRVAYIHNASYLGGLIGLIVALTAIRPAHVPESG